MFTGEGGKTHRTLTYMREREKMFNGERETDRQREIETERETERETQRERERERERESERERERTHRTYFSKMPFSSELQKLRLLPLRVVAALFSTGLLPTFLDCFCCLTLRC